jgi:hypothetical protein
MKRDFETKFTGLSFIVAAILLWGGWILLPHHIDEYLKASDFTVIGEQVWYWIWMFRIYIFGWVAMAVALFALGSIITDNPFRVVMYPGIGMTIAGTLTIAIAFAFYYNYGAWGVGKTAGKTPEEIQLFMDGTLFTNQYVTCFMRFGRIFSGVGLVLLGAGLLMSNFINKWLGWLTVLLGASAMGLILFIPEYFETYKPLFHLKVIWLILIGFVIYKHGVNTTKAAS